MKLKSNVFKIFGAVLPGLVSIASIPNLVVGQDSFSDISGSTGNLPTETKHLDGMVERDVALPNSSSTSSLALPPATASAASIDVGLSSSAVSSEAARLAPLPLSHETAMSTSTEPTLATLSSGHQNSEPSSSPSMRSALPTDAGAASSSPSALIADSPIASQASLTSSGDSSASFFGTPAPTAPPPMAITTYADSSSASSSTTSSIAATIPQPVGILPTPTPSRAELLLRSPSVSLIEYPVRGLNFDEINKDLDLFAAAATSGSKSDFGFAWTVTWEYTLDPVNQTPLVKVSPHFNVELPRWTEYDQTVADHRMKWDAYRAALLRSIEARILLVQAFVPRAETDIKSFLVQNPKAKQLEIDDVLKKTTRLLQARLQGLQATEAGDFPRQPLIGITASK